MTTIPQNQYETVIGLEVHLQLKTKTKIFCGCANLFGQGPNSLTCPVCLGLPGTLPVFNKMALEYAIKIALALNCAVNDFVKFDRKNYYYPDLPKGYQISQYDLPIASNGGILIPSSDEGKSKKIRIKRAHLEEDAGKLIHDTELNCSLVDYNRTGTPLMEIVTEPDIASPQEAYDYLQALKLILEYLDVSDCDMEKGSLRCDANISLRERASSPLGTKAEVKNMNSFKAVKAALEFEAHRQAQTLESGGRIIQETRLWAENKAMTLPMRSKEEAHDYRYFPEPDLVPFILEKETIERIRASIPELPSVKLARLMRDYQLNEYDARLIIQDRGLANFFEECAQGYSDPKKICNWITGPILQELNARKIAIDGISLKPRDLAVLIKKVEENILSNLAAKEVLKLIIETGKNVEQIIEEKGFAQVSDENTLNEIVDELIKEHGKIVQQIKEGKESAIGFLVGQAMRKTEGKGNPKKIGEIIKRRLFHV